MKRIVVLLAFLAVPLFPSAALAFDGPERLLVPFVTTARFFDVDTAVAAGYSLRLRDLQGIDCIAQPGEGAMGIHMVNPSLLDGTIDAAQPEALMYEPLPGGRLRLVAVEYVVFQSAWRGAQPPSLFGRQFGLVPAPNRFGLPPFYELHAWIWKWNPSGLFADWNPRVGCV